MILAPWLLLASAHATPLAATGEVLGGLEVIDVVEHREFQRVAVGLEDGRTLWIEVNANASATGACAAHGLSVFPRWELLDESVELADQPPVVAALCARLEERGEALTIAATVPAGVAPVESAEPPPPVPLPHVGPAGSSDGPAPGFVRSWLHVPLVGLVLALLAALVGPVRRGWVAMNTVQRLDLGLVLGLGAAVRLLASPRGVFWGPFFGTSRLVEAWGQGQAHPLYGGGFAALHGPISAAFDHAPGALFGTHLALASLAPPLLWALARMLSPDDRVGPLVAGLGLALLPAHVWLSGSEVMHIPLATLELLSVAAAVGFTRTGSGALAAVSALAIGFAAHIRPEVAPVALVPAAWVLAQPPRGAAKWVVGAALVIAALVGHRALDIVFGAATPALDYGMALASPSFWAALLLPGVFEPGASRYSQVFLQLRLTPFALPAFAAAALAWGRPRRGVALAVGWGALAILPVLAKSWPLADALRLQLPGQMPALLLAGLGAAALVRRVRAPLWAAPAAVIALSLVYLPLVMRPWAAHVARDFLYASAPALPDGATVLYDDGNPTHHPPFGRSLRAHTGVRWVGIQAWRDAGEGGSPLFAWVGESCQTRPHDGSPSDSVCGLLDACTLVPWKTTTVPARADVDRLLPDPTEPVGFYRVDECRFSEGAR